MKKSTLFYIGIVVLFMSSCGNQDTRNLRDDGLYGNEAYENRGYSNEEYGNGNQGDYNYQEGQQSQQVNYSQNNNSNIKARGNGKVIQHPIKDQSGRVIGQVPLPANWRVNAPGSGSQAMVEGPNGIKAYEAQGAMFSYSNDPYMQQMYQQSGQQMKRPKGVDRVVTEDLKPLMEKAGLRLVNQYRLPNVAQYNQKYDSQLWKVMQSQSTFQASGTEWQDQKGNTSLVIVNYNENTGQGLTYWGYYCTVLEAPNKHFEAAKNHFINGMVSKEFTAAHFQEYNQKEQQKAYASNSAHQQKMARNQANFDAQQAAHRSNSDAINNSIMSSWRSKNDASDRAHSSYINSIRDENTVYNSTNGQSYQVESGYNQTWMNSSGEAIQSNDYFYNPNADNNVNNANWEETEFQY